MRHKKNLHKYEDFFSFVGMIPIAIGTTPLPPDVCPAKGGATFPILVL